MTRSQKILLTVVAAALSLVLFVAGMDPAHVYYGTTRTWRLLVGLGLPVLILGGVAYLWTLKGKSGA